MKTLSLKYLHLFQSLQTLIDDIFKITSHQGVVIIKRQVVLLEIPKRAKIYLNWQNGFCPETNSKGVTLVEPCLSIL